MRKKSEKLKTPNPAQEETEDDSAYTPKGIFSEDFTRLCRKEGMYEIPIVTRPNTQEEKPPSSNGTAEDRDSTCLTSYRLVPNGEYTSPRIEVSYESEQDLTTLKHFSFRGYKLSSQLLHLLSTCFPSYPQLQFISLWNVGLTHATLSELAKLAANLTALRRLVLDGNPVPSGDFSALLTQERSAVETLSLRACALSDEQCSALGAALRKNKTLTFLNLSNNNLDDSRGIAISSGLRTNRTLHSLSLAGNALTDATAEFFAKSILQEFPLTHEEIVERRTLVFASLTTESPHIREQVDSPAKLNTSQGTPSPVPDRTSSVKLTRATAQKGAVSSKNIPRDEKSAKTTDKVKAKPLDSAKKRGGGSKMAKRAQEQVDSDKQDVFEYANPLLEKVSMREKQIFIPGNMTLLSLNLSYNMISIDSVSSLLAAATWQAAEPKNPYKPGLLRVCLRNNLFSEDVAVCAELRALLSKQNPLSAPKESVETQREDEGEGK